jgi:LysR family hydrogen peroxide-inducible transcriptional activator
METQHIEYFLAICDELNFTRAAEKCGVAQPTVTAAIQRMERKVGGALFQRLPHPPYVQLTALGRQLYPICIQISELLTKAQAIGGRVNRSKRHTRETPYDRHDRPLA